MLESKVIYYYINALESVAKISKFPELHAAAQHMTSMFQEYQIYETLFETGKIATQETDIETLLTRVLDLVIEKTRAENGMIILLGEQGEINVELARNAEKVSISRPEREISRNIIHNVNRQRTSICLADALKSEYRQLESVGGLAIRSVICSPIMLKATLIGVIYLDNRNTPDLFNEMTILLLEKLGEQIAFAVDNLLNRNQLERQNNDLEALLRSNYNFEPFIGHHASMVRIMDIVSKVARTDATVLIEGETGTGKELVARALHFNSHRAKKALIAINCAAMPENLLESELFGYVRGAFTGANSDKKGKFEVANGGTIFLDEIGEMHQSLQVKLLRILQSGEYSPVGSEEVRRCDVRIIAATNRDLKKLVDEGNFRNDLYYRLNIVRLTMPRLVDRRSDILVLADHFLKKYRQKVSKPSLKLSRAAQQHLLHYHYPGNVRELENIIERATIMAKGDFIESEDLVNEVRTSLGDGVMNEKILQLPFKAAKRKIVEEFERTYIAHTLAEARGVIRKAAEAAKMDVKNFYTKLVNLGIKPEEFK